MVSRKSYEPQPQSINEVRIVGRLGQNVNQRDLPSGDLMVCFSIVVDRAALKSSSRVKVDTIVCQATTKSVVSRLDSLEAGQWVQVEGVLRRRFWRSGAGLGSAMEVEVRRLVRARVAR